MSRIVPLLRLLPALLFVPALALAQPGAEPEGDGHRAPPPAQGHCPPPAGPEMPGMLPPWLHGVELSEAQQDKIFALQHAQAPALREASKKLRHAREELAALPFAAKYDEARAKALAEAEGRAVSELELIQTSVAARLYGVLTPEQQQQIAAPARRPAPPRPEGGRNDKGGPR